MAVTKLSNLSVTSGRSYSSLLAGNPTYVASSYESIATATGTGSVGNITFTSIPSTFKHLQIRYLVRDTAGGTSTIFYGRVNNDSGTNYARHRLYGDGASALAAGQASDTQYFGGLAALNGATASVMGVGVIDILDYASSTKNKTIRSLFGADFNGSGSIQITSALWINTNAITELSFSPPVSAWTTTTTFALYGIKEF